MISGNSRSLLHDPEAPGKALYAAEPVAEPPAADALSPPRIPKPMIYIQPVPVSAVDVPSVVDEDHKEETNSTQKDGKQNIETGPLVEPELGIEESVAVMEQGKKAETLEHIAPLENTIQVEMDSDNQKKEIMDFEDRIISDDL